MSTTYGALSLIPVAVVIISAVITKRALEPLILGSLVAFFIAADKGSLAHAGFFVDYLKNLYEQIGASAYFIILFGLFGAYVKLLESSGAIKGFADWGMKFATSKRKTGVLTWLVGMILFLDNYFSILGAGVSMKKIADRNKMSREMFSFTINVTAAAICILVPISAWGIFMGGQIDKLDLLSEGGAAAFAKSVPFMFYAWVALIVMFLYHMRIIPLFGPMKKAELRAETEGKKFPIGVEVPDLEAEEDEKSAPAYNFIVPMLGLIIMTVATKELVYGLVVGIILCAVLFAVQRIIKVGHFFDLMVEGFQDMVLVTAIVISAFVLQAGNDKLGLAPYVIDSVKPFLSPALLPVITFVVLSALSFVTGSFWGMAAISFPIIVPLALQIGVDPYLAIGAVVAGTSLGSSTCFYCDSVTLTCGTTGIRNADYLKTAVPLVMPMAAISLVMYLVAGFVFA